MLVIAHHNISDPEKFWAAAQEVTGNLPENLKLHSVFPARDGKTGTCLWSADSVDAVQQFIDKNSGQYAKNFCYELDAEKSMGLPEFKLAEASAN